MLTARALSSPASGTSAGQKAHAQALGAGPAPWCPIRPAGCDARPGSVHGPAVAPAFQTRAGAAMVKLGATA